MTQDPFVLDAKFIELHIKKKKIRIDCTLPRAEKRKVIKNRKESIKQSQKKLVKRDGIGIRRT